MSLIGLPGSGKTITIAKLATETALNGRRRRCHHRHRARGGVEQLAAFTEILNIDLMRADDPAHLRDAHGGGSQGPSSSTMPAPTPSTRRTRPPTGLSRCRQPPHLVMAAGGDTSEAAEIADAFKKLGVRGLIATRLDITRRIGALLPPPPPAILLTGLHRRRQRRRPAAAQRGHPGTYLAGRRHVHDAAPGAVMAIPASRLRPPSRKEIDTMVGPRNTPASAGAAARGDKLLAVASGKGGVGKTWFRSPWPKP